MRFAQTGLILGFVVCASSLAYPATVTSYVSKEGKVVVILSGEILPGDTEQLARIIKSANDSGKFVSGIRLNSPGGNLLEGAKLADSIRFGKIASVVPNGSTCASACFIAFAAGAEKYVSYTAAVGVHGASDKNGQESESANAATVAMAKIVKELGVPSEIIGRMVVTPPSDMVWLSPNNLRAMGATMTGKPNQTPAANAPVQSLTQSTAQPAAINTWSNLVNAAIQASSVQHKGTALVNRVCQPEFKTCAVAIFYTSKDGKDSMLRTTEDQNGQMISREICEFNQFGDVRFCVDWDRGTQHRDMQDPNGKWSQIDDK